MDDLQLKVLDCLRQSTRPKTKKEIYQYCCCASEDVSQRSVERAVNKLATLNYIEPVDATKQRNQQWQLCLESALFSANLSAFDALMIKLLYQHSRAILPASNFSQVLLDSAELVINKLPPSSPYRKWHKKVFIEQRGQPLLPPEIDQDI